MQSQWFDTASNTPTIMEHSRRLESFLTAVANGVVDDKEVKSQEARVVALMKEIEPQLPPALHDKVTQLLCELTAYDLMQVMHSMHEARPRTVFRG